jgi:hypothetical protein
MVTTVVTAIAAVGITEVDIMAVDFAVATVNQGVNG